MNNLTKKEFIALAFKNNCQCFYEGKRSIMHVAGNREAIAKLKLLPTSFVVK